MFHLKRSLMLRHGHHRAEIQEVRNALQGAITLEHSTIPLYLYAMFSLDPSVNGPVIDVLRSAVIEEMLHITLAANVLNALGGEPRLTGEGFVPRYPGHLPGGVEDQMTVHLRPFSIEQLKVFAEIEEPRQPIAELATGGPDEIGSCTIGEFYLSIERAIGELGPKSFIGDASRQVGGDLMFGAIAVHDVESAVQAINLIIEQGEGSTSNPMEGDAGAPGDLAHYYRFMQVVHGRRLVSIESSPGFAYEGEAVSVDPDGVVALPSDPRAADFAPGTDARTLVDTFNQTYRSLLETLEALFNGHVNSGTFSSSLASMESLSALARQMVEHSLLTGEAVGPTFELSWT